MKKHTSLKERKNDMILGYIRVSTVDQSVENQKNEILRYAQKNKMMIDEFLEVEISSRKNRKERKINMLLERLKENDTLIVTELSRLGRSVLEVSDIINTLIEKKIKFISIKEDIKIDKKHTFSSKVMTTMFSLVSELERDLISKRTKEALKSKKQQGVKLGRPKGLGKSKLDKHKDQIIELLNKEVSIRAISKILEEPYQTVYSYIKKRKDKWKKEQKLTK